METREEKQQLARTKFDARDTEYFEGILRYVQALFREQYEEIKSIAGWERSFLLTGSPENAAEWIEHFLELKEIAATWEKFYRELSRKKSNPCARLCGKIAGLYKHNRESAMESHRNTKKAFKKAFGIAYKPKG